MSHGKDAGLNTPVFLHSMGVGMSKLSLRVQDLRFFLEGRMTVCLAEQQKGQALLLPPLSGSGSLWPASRRVQHTAWKSGFPGLWAQKKIPMSAPPPPGSGLIGLGWALGVTQG